MAVTSGTRLGPYEILSPVGAGGMGEVYRARDTKLGRDVALKFVPELFASDPDRLARFTREAQTLAALNHPNIAHVHGLEESGGVRALVMELVEGEDLAQRLVRGPIPVEEALPIARQIAEALEAAHEQGIIHRDLKPANIKVRDDGTVKVLDFGLAKGLAGDVRGSSGAAPLANSPTLTSPAMTQAGMILGTAAYMSPEQAKGRPLDKRADIWAFGAVLFEMLTGTRAFAGADVQDTFMAIMRDEPDWPRLPARLSPALGAYLRRCLEKDPKQRIHDIADVRLALDGAFETPLLQTTAVAAPARAGRRPWAAAFAVAAVSAAALAIPAVKYLRETPPPAPAETRVEIVSPASDDLTSFALSPDGRQIVFVASGDGASRLWLRSLATTTAQPLAGTEGATAPFWAPDSRSLGFFAAGSLKRLDLGGGAPQALAAAAGRGGTWSGDGVIVFGTTGSPLMRVSATGGGAVAVTKLGPQQIGHRWPYLLPDGRRFLFYVLGASDTAGIYLGSLDGSAPTRLTAAEGAGVYLSPGWLLWIRAGMLVAQRLDLARAALTGAPVTLANDVAVDALFQSPISVAATGLVAYRMGAGSQRQLTWVDRSGKVLGAFGDADGNSLSTPRLSPDGRRVAVTRTVQGNTDLWLMDGARTRKFTSDAASDNYPVWSPDGTRIVFRSARTGQGDLFRKLASGAGEEEPLVVSDRPKSATSWSGDGRFLLFTSLDPQTSYDLWVVPMAEGGRPAVLLKTPFNERYGTFSPDGRWLAYHSNESGRYEVYVRPFVQAGTPDVTDRARDAGSLVSTTGGSFPTWRPDGKELYYLDATGAMMAAPITVTGATLAPGAPVRLFSSRIAGGGVDSAGGRQYDVAPDGRFLINALLDSTTAPITLLMNWSPEPKR